MLSYVRALQNSIGSNVKTLHRLCSDKVEALEFKVSQKSSLTGIPIEKLSIRKNILIACINRRGKIFMPRGNDNIQPGDNVIIVTTESGLKDLDDIAAK